jgi:hypothetical protein
MIPKVPSTFRSHTVKEKKTITYTVRAAEQKSAHEMGSEFASTKTRKKTESSQQQDDEEEEEEDGIQLQAHEEDHGIQQPADEEDHGIQQQTDEEEDGIRQRQKTRKKTEIRTHLD